MLESLRYEETGTQIPKIAEFLEQKWGVEGEFTDTELANIADLGLDTESENPLAPEDVNAKISGRFDAEVQKAGLGSYDTPGLSAIKEQFNTVVQNTPDMEAKLKLYSAFMEELAGKVGTTVAEQNQRSQQNAQNMVAEQTVNTEKNQNRHAEMLRIAQEFQQLRKEAMRQKLAHELQLWNAARSQWNQEQLTAQASAENLSYPA